MGIFIHERLDGRKADVGKKGAHFEETAFFEQDDEPTILVDAPVASITAVASGHEHGAARSRRIVIDGFPFCVGRLTPRGEHGLVIEDISISRRHAEISIERGVFFITDVGTNNEGSKGGTYINGERVAPGRRAIIKDGDRLRFYKTEYDFHVGA